MTDTPKTESQGRQRVLDVQKSRLCLKCRVAFSSEWSGERVCSRCKGTKAWRDGVPDRSYSTRSRH